MLIRVESVTWAIFLSVGGGGDKWGESLHVWGEYVAVMILLRRKIYHILGKRIEILFLSFDSFFWIF